MKHAIPLGKGEMPAEARATDEEMDAAIAELQRRHPEATILVERRPGGAVKVTIASPEHGLYVSGDYGYLEDLKPSRL